MTMESNNSINLKGFQLYQASLTSSTNITSNLLLTEVWNKHVKQFDNQALELPNNRNNTLTWKSSLSMLKDPEELFQKSIPPCSSCSNTITALDIDKITKNTCKCDPSVIKEIIKEDKHKGIQKTFVLSDDSDDDQKFKPTFRPPKLKRNISAPQQLNEKPPNYRVPKEMEYDIDVVDEDKAHASNVSKLIFKTAKDQFLSSNPAAKRTLKASRRAQAKFVSPMLTQEKPPKAMDIDRFKHLDPKMVELIESEIIDKGSPVAWEDIAGLEMAKSVIQEAVVWPLLRPDIFTGLRRPPKGILLFGPPGTGKTLIGKCVASQCNATFFNISASSLTSKWIGDGEKMVRALFSVARCHQPAVIFIDEIDSILTQRSDSEHEASRRIKTEFLVQFDGAATAEEDSFLIIGATNRPQELDEAARRRLVKRLYIPLPDLNARKQIVTNLLQNEKHEIEEGDIDELSALTQGYSGADMKSLCSEAAMGPIRCVPLSQMVTIQKDNMRPVNFMDFKNALDRVKPSVSQDDLGQYVKWNNTFGQGF